LLWKLQKEQKVQKPAETGRLQGNDIIFTYLVNLQAAQSKWTMKVGNFGLTAGKKVKATLMFR
jgi:hypothetical protein